MSTYDAICSAKTKAEMQKRFSELLDACVKKFGGTRKSHSKMQLSNVGYFAGYYDYKTRNRVSKWIGAEHPIFGKTKPTAKQAYDSARRAT